MVRALERQSGQFQCPHHTAAFDPQHPGKLSLQVDVALLERGRQFEVVPPTIVGKRHPEPFNYPQVLPGKVVVFIGMAISAKAVLEEVAG